MVVEVILICIALRCGLLVGQCGSVCLWLGRVMTARPEDRCLV